MQLKKKQQQFTISVTRINFSMTCNRKQEYAIISKRLPKSTFIQLRLVQATKDTHSLAFKII